MADADAAEELFGTILSLLEQQQANLQHCPYTPEQLERDRKISARLRELCNELPGPRSKDQGLYGL